MVPTLLIASVVVFGLIQLVPGDPAVAAAGESATRSLIETRRHQLGLDQPLPEQYGSWLGGVLHGDLGNSLISGEPVRSAISRAVPVTFSVVALAVLISLLLGVPGGVMAAWNARRPVDRVVTTVSSIGIAIPSFWLSLILVSWLAIQTHAFPATGYVSVAESPFEAVRHLFLPAFAIGVVGAAAITRQLRSAMMTSLGSDYVRTLHAKGVQRRHVVLHALKNSAIPLLTVVGLEINAALGATVVVESVFGLSGLGNLIFSATLRKDYVVIQGVVLVMALIVITVNVVVDILYRVVDPRIQ